MKKITLFYKKIVFILKKKKNIDNDKFDNKTLNDIFSYYGTDKANKVKNQYDVNSKNLVGHGYAKFYEKHLSNYKYKNFNLLEIGTWYGASTASFAKYFPRANIFGIDRNFKFKYKSNRIKFLHCDLREKENLNILKKKIQGKKFKIIIDDGSHILSHIIKNIIFFIRYVESGGYFVIEDFNHPKNYKHLNDGDNKELFIDEILKNIKNKKNFMSDIFTKTDQKKIFKIVDNIYIYKGKNKDSDIAFLKIK